MKLEGAVASGVSAECLAIVLCESVVEDVRTHNKSIQSAYNAIWSAKFPARHDRFTVFVSLMGIHGEQELKVRVARITENEPEGAALLELGGKVAAPDPRHVTDITLDMRGIVIPCPGDYEIRAYVGGDQVGARRFVARAIDQAADQKSGGER